MESCTTTIIRHLQHVSFPFISQLREDSVLLHCNIPNQVLRMSKSFAAVLTISATVPSAGFSFDPDLMVEMFKLTNHKAYLEISLNDQLCTPITKTSTGWVSTARKPKSVSVRLSLKVLIVMFVLVWLMHYHGSNNHNEMAYE